MLCELLQFLLIKCLSPFQTLLNIFSKYVALHYNSSCLPGEQEQDCKLILLRIYLGVKTLNNLILRGLIAIPKKVRTRVVSHAGYLGINFFLFSGMLL